MTSGRRNTSGLIVRCCTVNVIAAASASLPSRRHVGDEIFFGELMSHFVLLHRHAVFSVLEKRFDEKSAVFADIRTRDKVVALDGNRKKYI